MGMKETIITHGHNTLPFGTVEFQGEYDVLKIDSRGLMTMVL